jgi:hydrogenase nickel incorporation protein HypA/HybF
MRRQIVPALLESALQRARQTGALSIRGCAIALGELVDITPEAFRIEWRNLARGTPAEHAVLTFRTLPAELQCMTCFHKYHPPGPAPACPACGGVGARVIHGEEYSLDSLQVD